MAYEELPTPDLRAFRGHFKPFNFGGMTGPEFYAVNYHEYNTEDWIKELKVEEDKALKEELHKVMSNSNNEIDKETTKEEFITNFRNQYRRKREEEQREDGQYG